MLKIHKAVWSFRNLSFTKGVIHSVISHWLKSSISENHLHCSWSFLVKESTDLKATGEKKEFLKSCIIKKTLKTEHFAKHAFLEINK